jgi:hypothetical protein
MLPPGRYRATSDELYARFVDGQGERRAELWRDWTSATHVLGRLVSVNAAWLHGAFISDAPAPELVQCIYWAEDVEVNSAGVNPPVAKALGVFAVPGKVREVLGVKVDTRLMHWHCQPDMRYRNEYYATYTKFRGEIDDRVQRVSTSMRGAEPVRDDALPRRGYVEVIIGDFL